jgi:rSAM/selenodomain-associated transferase 1
MVIAKRPAPGQTKTRLSPLLGYSVAAQLYTCFLRDTLDLVRTACAARPDIRPGLLYLPHGAEDYFRELAPGFELLLQQGDGLGERLDHAFTHLLAQGYRQAAVIDSDSPTLPVACLYEAFAALDDGADVALGPCADGGYYLIALSAPQPRLLREVVMSTPQVTEHTLALARVMGLRAVLTRPWYDVDTAGELARLQRELCERPGGAPHTRAFLAAVDVREVMAENCVEL